MNKCFFFVFLPFSSLSSSASSSGTHQTPGPALIQILDGTAYFTVGNEEVNLPQGKSLLIPAGVPHSVIARERFKMQVTSILPLD